MITAAHRRTCLRAALALAIAGTGLAHAADPLVRWPGGATPQLRLRALDGTEVALADFRGRPVIVNFWATWCAPCVAEMPALQRLRDRLADRGVEVVSVNFQENAARIRPFLYKYGLSFPVLRDHDGSVRDAWQVNVFPTTFVVDREGRIAWVARGEVDWDDAGVESRIRNL